MIAVSPLPPLDRRYFGGATALSVEAANLFGVVAALDRLAAGFAEEAALRVAFAVDGVVSNDWSAPLADGAQVTLFPRVAGGEGAAPWPVRRLHPFGIEVVGDLSLPLSATAAAWLRRLVHEHGLVLARDQALAMERQRALCAAIGPVLDRQGEDGIMSNEQGGPSSSALAWHADAAYGPHPFEALSLHALEVVDDTSSTRFIHAGQAWQALGEGWRKQLADAEQDMISPHYSLIDRRVCELRDPPALVRARRPARLSHPATGRDLIWVSELQTAALCCMAWRESRDILRQVFAVIYAPERVFEHRWRQGDLIIWDNIALQHSRPDLGNVGRRVLQRVIVGTEGVAPHVAAARA
jgi:taurine dioxygenase